MASSNVTRCLRALAAAFLGSQSNSIRFYPSSDAMSNVACLRAWQAPNQSTRLHKKCTYE
jgi:hypothetical protein